MKPILEDISLKKKLVFVYLLVVIVPIMFMGYFFSRQIYNLTISNDLTISNASHNQLRDNFLNIFIRYGGVMNGLASDATLMNYVDTNYDQDYQAIVDFRTKIVPFIRRAEIENASIKIRIYSDNRSIAHSEEMSNSLEKLASEPWYIAAGSVSPGRLNWFTTTKISNMPTGRYIGCFRTFLDLQDNQVNRVFTIFFNEDQLYSQIAKEREAGKIMFLVDGQDTIITSTERELLFQPASAAGEVLNAALAPQSGSSFFRYKDQDYMVLQTPLNRANIGISDWKLVSLIPAGTIRNSVRKIWIVSVALSALMILFSLVLVVGVAGNITKRVKSLISKMRRVIDSNYQVNIPASGKDEIGMIEFGLSDMISKTKALIDEVYVANLKIKDSEINYQKLQTEKRVAEIIALQEQINPHYLFNTLETIRMNLIINHDRKNAEIVELFAESFRNTIDTSREYYSLGEELDFVRKYFKIQEYRFRGGITMKIDVPEAMLSYEIPRLLIQPLVENAIYHGIELKGEPGEVRISGEISGSDLRIRVEDNGIGIAPEELDALVRDLQNPSRSDSRGRRKGIALKNIHNRLLLMYGPAYGLRISSTPDAGTCIEVRIPIPGQTAAEEESHV